MRIINQFTRVSMAMIMMLLVSLSATASSHREAPLISNDPLADNVDLYAFRSPDNPDMVTLIATYIPFQLPHGGPNYYTFGENVRYEIHVDNDASVPGDEVTYRFTFKIENEDPTTFFNIRLGKQNQKATYTLERSMDGGATFQTIITDGIVPPNNIGPRSIESAVGLGTTYDALWNNSIMSASTGERVFAGPSDDPFFVDLGGIFDLGDAPRQNGTPVDGVACYNVSTIAIQVPISTLRKTGAAAQPANILDSDYVIGVWASASRPAITTLSATEDPSYGGDWIQVSRLGMPLTNEAVIPVGDKDYWNSITPYEEIAETTMDKYFFNPELALYMDDDQFGGAVPAFGPLRIQTASLGAFDFTNGADGLFSLKGSDAVAGTALDDAVFGTLLLPGAGMPRSVDLWPAFHTGVPNVIPYQLATGKEGNPLGAGKPFVNNFLPNGGDMLRLNMAVPVTSRSDANFSSLGLIQAAAIGLTVSPFNTRADLEFIPNMDGFPNGRRLEDDVTRIELQAVSGAVLAAIGLWYDDYDPATSPSPVTQGLLNVLSYTTGVEANDKPFSNSFPYVAMPHSGTGDCSGAVVQDNNMVDAGDTTGTFYVSSNTEGSIGVYNIRENGSLDMSMIPSQATDADGIYYDQANDVIYQLNRSDNVINAYSNVSTSPTLTATSTSDFSNGREIAVSGNKLVVAQDETDSNGGNKFIIYTISPTSITLDKVYDADINLWGMHVDGSRLFAIVDNSSQVVLYNDFFTRAAGPISITNRYSIDGLVRTHGITFDSDSGTMYLTDVGSGAVADDGAIVIIPNFEAAVADMAASPAEQIRIAGPSTFLGNPVDIAYDAVANRVYVAERANEGGRVLGFNVPATSGDVSPNYNKLAPGASAINFAGMAEMLPIDPGPVVATFFNSSNTTGSIGVYNVRQDGSVDMSMIGSQATDADGIYYDQANDVLYQLNRTANVINAYSNVSTNPTLTATSTSNFSNGREIAVSNNKLVVAQDASDSNNGNQFAIYTISPTSITFDKTYVADINLWGIHADGGRLFAIVDNSNEVVVYNDFFNQNAGAITESARYSVEGIVRTHGLTFDATSGTMYLTDVGSGAVADDGAIVIIPNFASAVSNNTVSSTEQVRIAGPSTLLGNPVDIAYEASGNRVYVAERANNGGRILGFNVPTTSGDRASDYSKDVPGASAIHTAGPAQVFEEEDPVVLEGCYAPQNISIRKSGSKRVRVTWDRVPDARSYEIRIGFEGSPKSFVTIPVSRRTIFISGPADRTIVFQVRAVCSITETSEYSEMTSYTTGSGSRLKSDLTDKITVSEIDFDKEIEIFPNPSNDLVNIAYKTSDAAVSLGVYNMTGQLMMTQKLDAQKELHTISIADLADGAYMIILSSKGNVLQSEKVIRAER